MANKKLLVFCSLPLVIAICIGMASITAPVSSAKKDKGPTERDQVPTVEFDTSVRKVPVFGNNLIYDQKAQKLYVSVPGEMGISGNSIATVDPFTGTLENSAYVGSEPNKMVMASDGHTLYVSLNGARSVRKFDTASQTGGLQFPVGADHNEGPLRLMDMAAPPDNADMVAIARCSAATSLCQKVAIYDNGVPRPAVLGEGKALTFSGSSSTLFGVNNSGELETLSVSATGITALVENAYDVPTMIKFANGLVYGSRGKVIDATTKALVGTFLTGTSSNLPFVLDLANHKIFFLRSNNGQLTISAFNTDTYVLIGSITTPSAGTITGIERWGSNGLVVSNSDGPLLLIQSTLVNSSDPVPTVTPTPFTSTPTPTPIFARRVDQPSNDIFFNEAEEYLYITVPGTATNGTGNSITRIDPQTGSLVSSTFIGSEPGLMARSDDGRTIYVSLNGANAIRRFDTSTQIPGLQFANAATTNSVVDIAVVPGSPDSVVVGTGNTGAAIYDNGIKRPNIPRNGNVAAWIGPVEFSDAPNILYGYNNVSTGFDLYKVSVDANGLTNIGSTRNLVSGFGNQDIKFIEGKIFTRSGQVADPLNNILLGTYFNDFPGRFTLDTQLRKVFLASNNAGVTVYDMDTYVRLGTLPLTNLGGSVAGIVRWGTNGLAIRVSVSSSQQYILLVQSPLVSTAVPTPTGLNLAASNHLAFENSGTITVTINRNGDLSQATTIKYSTVDGTATAGSDFTATSGTMLFAPGETAKTFTIPILDDNVFETFTAETFGVNISDPTGANVQLLSPIAATVTLNDNDQRPSISDENTSVNENTLGNTSIANLAVRLSHPSVQNITVNYATADGSATAGSDYQVASGTLTFGPMETVKSVPVTILGDNNIEGNEGFFLNISSPVNGTILNSSAAVIIIDHMVHSAARPEFDYDGDGKTDISVFRPSSGVWYVQNSSDSTFSINQWGINDDLTVPADYDGDGKTDLAVWRPSNGVWFWINSANGTVGGNQFGLAGDKPAPGDYDGDGKADIMIFRPSTGMWWLYRSTDNGVSVTQFGIAEDNPTIGDFDGDGKSDVAVFRPSNAAWYRLNSSDGTFVVNTFGLSDDKPVAADYDGDGKSDIAIWRPSNGAWYWMNSSNGAVGGVLFGLTEDKPTPGDYDGDGKSDPAVFRPSQSIWYMLRSTQGFTAQQFGASGDIPTPNSFVP